MASDYSQAALDYQRIEKAIDFLEGNFERQPSLAEIARSAHLSEYHFQRLFRRWVGISPKRFLQFLTKEYAKDLLQRSRNLLDVTYETGLSSPGRLHDLFVSCEAVTPGEFKKKGEGVRLGYGFHPTPFGECLLAMTDRGICWLTFVKSAGREAEREALRRKWPNAELAEDVPATKRVVQEIFGLTTNGRSTARFRLHLQGTNFQLKVWEALLRIPAGSAVAYEEIAEHIGKPKAVRAVANAVANNPVAFLIPCHRVIRKLGEFGGYRGGAARKKAILAWEGVQHGRV